jgi:hypothetical protein
MATLGTSWAQVHPSRIEPGVLMQISQASQAQRLLADGKPRIMLDPEDLYVYMRTLGMNGQAQVGQTAGNLLPGATLIPKYISTPTYRIRAHAEWDHHDAANMSRWGVNIAQGYRLANRQTIFQVLRNMQLYGVNAANGEGFLNGGGTAVSLPPDTFGNTTVLTYDSGQMALWLLQQLLNLKARTYQLGKPHRFVFLGPQRIIGQFELVNVVQLTSYQRLGSGSATTAEMVKQVAKETQGDVIEFCYDDTLIGQGAGGSDMVILQMPEVEEPNGPEWDTNEFAKLQPNLAGCSFQYADMAAPLEITVPLALGAVDTLYEIRATCGWPVRPETTSLLSIIY